MPTDHADPVRTATGDPRPPAPPAASLPPPRPAAAASHEQGRTAGEEPLRPWRDRLPEIVGAIGTLLVAGAVVGFLSSTWEALDAVGRGLVLAGAGLGTTLVAAQLERGRDGLATLVSMLWLSATALTGAAVVLLVAGTLAPPARVVALVAGLAAAAHGAAALRRGPTRSLRQFGVVGGLLTAAGAFGTSWDDRIDGDTLLEALTPVGGLLDPTLESAAHAITGPAHLLVGVAWLLLGLRAGGRVGRVAEVGATVLVGYAALELLVVPSSLGAFTSLLVVLALLAHGLVTERTGRVLAGAVLTLICAGRVVWSLFSGEVAVTVAALAVGLALLTWALRARQRSDEGATGGAPDDLLDDPRLGAARHDGT